MQGIGKEYLEVLNEAKKTMSEKDFNEAKSEGKAISDILDLASARKALDIESRSDIKVSTLLAYLESMGLKVKITGVDPKTKEEYELIKMST